MAAGDSKGNLALWLLAYWVFNDPLARDANASSNYKGH